MTKTQGAEIAVGQKAPQFSLLDDTGKEVSLSNFKGKKVILYFYPKDNTPGCSMEANDFNGALEVLQNAGYIVLGVSRDSVKKHSNFKAKLELKFTLLADTEEIVCQLYDVLKEKKNYGKTYIGIERSTFVIDENGMLSHIYRGVSAKEHVEKLMKEIL